MHTNLHLRVWVCGCRVYCVNTHRVNIYISVCSVCVCVTLLCHEARCVCVKSCVREPTLPPPLPRGAGRVVQTVSANGFV